MWILKPLAVALLGLPVLLLGLVLVPLGLRFRREYPETRKPFTQYPGEWMLVRMPAWLLPWDNIYDGFRGDKRDRRRLHRDRRAHDIRLFPLRLRTPAWKPYPPHSLLTFS